MPNIDDLAPPEARPTAAGTSRPRPPSFGRFAVPVAAFAAAQSFAWAQAEPAGGAESAFLARLILGTLAAMAALSPRPARELGWTAVLSLASLWMVDYGPHRGALITLLLSAGLALAAIRRWHRDAGRLTLRTAVPLAFGLQVLLRPDLLLPPLLDARTLVSAFALPAAAGAATYVLTRHVGHRAAWMAGTVAVVLAPGWNVTVTFSLLCLAAGAEAARGSVPVRVAAVALFAAACVWRPMLGPVLALGGLTLALTGRWQRGALALIATAAAALAWLPTATPRALEQVFDGPWPALMLIPALPLTKRPWLAATGLVLMWAAGRNGSGLDAFAGPLALIASTLPVEGGVGALQRAWSWTLLTATGLLATYPWVRPGALEQACELLSLPAGWKAWALLAALICGLGWALGRLPTQRASPPGVLTAVGLSAALLLGLESTAVVPLSYEVVALDIKNPEWSWELPPEQPDPLEIRTVVLDSNLIHSEGLLAGTPVLEGRLLDIDGRTLRDWQLLAGRDTAEWATDRPDVAARARFEAPSPWLAYLAPDGSFLGRRFRSHHTGPSVRASRLVLRRSPELPPQVQPMLYQVELRH